MINTDSVSMTQWWRSFQKHMIPEDASSNQVFDMKAAFWGGAYITMQTYQLATEAVKNGKMDLAIKLVKDMESDIEAMMEALSNDQV